MSNADTALERAINTTGDYVGVVLSHGGTWSSFPFVTRKILGDWYGDWFGNPSEYSFLAAYDKTAPQWNDGLAVTSVGNFFGNAPDATDIAITGAVVTDEIYTISPLRRLAEFVALHEVYWTRVAQRNARSATMRTFVRDVWDPYYAKYVNFTAEHNASDVSIAAIAELAAELDNIRSLARSRAIPVPDITPSEVSSGAPMSNHFVGGPGRGGSGGGVRVTPAGGGRPYPAPAPFLRPPTPLPPQPAPVQTAPRPDRSRYERGRDRDDRRDRLDWRGDQRGRRDWSDRGRHGHGGFYRHGSRWPGRWFHGDFGPYWYEGPEVIYATDPVPPELANLPPPTSADQPIAPEAQGAPPMGAVDSSDGAGDASDDTNGANGANDASNDGNADDSGDSDQSSTVASGWLTSARRQNDGSKVPSLVELANLISPDVGARITLSLDRDTLTAIVQTGGKAYQGSADMSAVLAQLDSRTDKRIEAFYRALVAPKALVGLSPLLGGAAPYDGAPVVVGGGCGTRSYANVSRGAIRLILQRLANKGAAVTGDEKNGWYVITNDHGVEFKGTWNQAAQTLDLEVTDSDFAVPCSAVWHEIESMLHEIGIEPVAVLDTSPTFDAIRLAGHTIVGCLLDQHAINTSGEVLAGWGFLGDIGDAFKAAGKGIGKGFMWTQHESALVVQKLKTPITIAATAVATVYGGPVAGAAAAKFMGPLIDSQVAVGDKISGKKVNWDGSPDTSEADAAAAKQQAAQQIIASAAQAAKTNPTIAKALGSAQKALAHTVAAYQTADTVQKAAAGDPNAQAQVGQLKQAAANGNSGASSLMNIAEKALGSYLDDRASNPNSVMSPDYKVDDSAIEIDAPAASSGNYAANIYSVNSVMGADPIVRANNSAAMLRARAAHGVHDRASRQGDAIYGALLDPSGTWSFPVFTALDEADDWMGRLASNPESFVYVGYFDTADPMWPHPINDVTNPGQRAHDAHDPAISSGWIAPLLAATGGFAAGMWGPDLYRWSRAKWDARKRTT